MERMSRVRALLLLIGIPLMTWQIWLLAQPFFTAPVDEASDSLARLLGWMLYLAWAWVAVTVVVAAGEAVVTGRLRLKAPLAPRAARTFVAAICGLGIAAGGGAAQAAASSDLDGLPLPDRVVGRTTETASPPSPSPSTSSAHVPTDTTAASAAPVGTVEITVRPGDCLWRIAHRHATTWRAIYELNRSVIGDDPDLIFPGQRLVLPADAR